MELKPKALLAFLTYASVTIASAGNAQTALDARSLLDACTRADESLISFCNGYIQSAADFAILAGNACIPDGVTRTEIATGFDDTIGSSLALDPNMGGESGFAVMVLYLSENYPC